MNYIVAISGSPSSESRSSILVNYLRSEIESKGIRVKEASVLDFQPDVLIQGQYDHPSIQKFSEDLKGASGIIIISPVYKAAYSGALKTLLDILPQDVFKDKPLFPLMVGGSQAHLLAIDYSLKPLLAALSAQTILKGVYVLDKYVDKTNILHPISEEEIRSKITIQLGQFLEISKKISSITNAN